MRMTDNGLCPSCGAKLKFLLNEAYCPRDCDRDPGPVPKQMWNPQILAEHLTECRLVIRTGPVPARPEDLDSGVALVSFLVQPTVAKGGAIHFKTKNTVSNTGIARYFRLYEANQNYRTGSGRVILQGRVGLHGSGADLVVDNDHFTTGQIIEIDFTISSGNV